MTLYKWHEPYQAALLEFHTEQLKKEIAAAESAIFQRFQELAGESDHTEERARLNEALRALRALQTERLGYPLLRESEGINS